MRAEHCPEHLLLEVIAPAASAPAFPPLERGPAATCIACGSHGRRLWHGVCAWCGADLEDLEDLEQD